MKLTPRLNAIAGMVKFRRVADIGTDHGKIPVYLVKNNMCDYVVACDINEGPAKTCEMNVRKHGLEDFISTKVCDGLKGLEKDECESVVIAGMGGELISKILEDSFEIACYAKELILQPMTGTEELKVYLSKRGYRIVEEKLVSEKNKVYLIIKAVFDVPYTISFKERYISDKILNDEISSLRMYLEKLLNKLKNEVKGIEKNDNKYNDYLELIKFLEDKYESC